MQVANPNRAQFTKCARTAIPYTTYESKNVSDYQRGRHKIVTKTI